MEDEIDLREYLAVIQKRWKMVVFFAVVSGLIAFYNAYSQPKLYKATATLMVTDSGGGGLGSALSSLSFLGGGGGGGGEGKLTPILKSRALAKEVAKSLELELVFPKLGGTKLTNDEKLLSAAGALQGAVDAKMGASGLFEVSVTWQDPEIAAELANKYVEGLGRFLNYRAFNINFQMIDPAVAPGGAFNRNPKQQALPGLAIGLFAGIFAAFLLEYFGKSKRPTKNDKH